MSDNKQEFDSATWGGYLDNNRVDIEEVISAFKDRGCEITLFEAAQFRELALLRSGAVIEADANTEDRDDGEAWKL